jgi:hypothetical protein
MNLLVAVFMPPFSAMYRVDTEFIPALRNMYLVKYI